MNATAGVLTIRGQVDLSALERAARQENYAVLAAPPGRRQPAPAPQGRRLDWNLVRAAIGAVAMLLGYAAEQWLPGSSARLLLYATAVVFGAWGNARKASSALPRLDFNMSVLMTFAVIGAMAIGEWNEGAMVAVLYAVSEWLESWTLERARRSIRALMDLAPRVARIRRGNADMELPVDDIAVGDLMIVLPGEKVAMDGRIQNGESALNEAAITGESVPRDKGPGDEVFAGTLNSNGSLEVEITRRAEDTTIARIIHMVEDAQTRRAPAQTFVERFAAVYTPIVLALAAGIAILPPLVSGGDWTPWIYRGLALMVVSCPCALVVSTPVAIISAVSNAARNGVLIKGGAYLEAAGQLAAVAFDKTGTLTRGQPAVVDVVPLAGQPESRLLALAAALEARSEHPLAAAIVAAARERGLSVFPAQAAVALPGRGIQGVVDGQKCFVGNLRLFAGLGLPTESLANRVERLQEDGKTAMVVGTDHGYLGIITVADQERADAAMALSDLKRAGVRHTVLLTGDNAATARTIAAHTGVDEYRADLLPQDKVAAVQELRQRYGHVAMVGDGINDAPALATATLGIAVVGANTDTALETADIALMGADLSRLAFTVRLSQAATTIIRQNIGFAIAIKVVAVLAVFPGWLTLWLAILADMGATVLVTLNGIRLLHMRVGK